MLVGPKKAVLEHVGAALPALGETIEDLFSHGPIRGADPTETAVLKGDPRMTEVVRRAVWAHVRRATEPLVVPRGIRKWRVPAYEVQMIVNELKAAGCVTRPGRMGTALGYFSIADRSGWQDCDSRMQDTDLA